MYEEFFGLREPPFRLTPDTSYFYAYSDHREALNTLLVAVRMGEGFLKVTGEVGTGKTLVCRKLLKELAEDDTIVTAYIPNPDMTPAALRYALTAELGIDYHRNEGQHEVMRKVNDCLIAHRAAGRSAVLIIDEAQALSETCLETVRLLTNLETEKHKLLQVVLFGQPELDRKLDRPSARQLKQRITFSYGIAPITRAAVAGYLAHRLEIAGYQGHTLFSPAIAQRIHRVTGGVPRLINIVAHKCMLSAYGDGRAEIGSRHLDRAVADTESLAQRMAQPVGFWVGMAGAASTAIAAGAWYLLGVAA